MDEPNGSASRESGREALGHRSESARTTSVPLVGDRQLAAESPWRRSEGSLTSLKGFVAISNGGSQVLSVVAVRKAAMCVSTQTTKAPTLKSVGGLGVSCQPPLAMACRTALYRIPTVRDDLVPGSTMRKRRAARSALGAWQGRNKGRCVWFPFIGLFARIPTVANFGRA